ncbi:MAG: dethiobiotin synthase [Planctomycetaceae bacterium]|nr:dethiobiotin synthase [Planctomycetaceae bacterium]
MFDPHASHRNLGLFVTGTDTGVGKTYITAALIKTWRSWGADIGAYKPAVSGCDFDLSGRASWADVEALYAALDGTISREHICPQCFAAPLAPPVAAEQEGRRVDDALLLSGAAWWQSRANFLLVEGAGGLLAPLSESQSNADLAVALNFPLLIIARTGLGTLNHTLLTVEAAQRRGIKIAGIVMNTAQPALSDLSVQSNPNQLAKRCQVPILAVLPHFSDRDLLQHPGFLRMADALWTSL